MIVLWLAAGLLASPAVAPPAEKQGGGGSSAYLTAIRRTIIEEYDRAENALREPVAVESAAIESSAAAPTPAAVEFEPAPAPINTAMRDAIIAAGIDARQLAMQARKRQDDEAIALILCVVNQ
jgi:hypothetical protein